METRDKIEIVAMIALIAIYLYFSYRIDKRHERMDKELLRGMRIAPVDFDSMGRIDDTKTD